MKKHLPGISRGVMLTTLYLVLAVLLASLLAWVLQGRLEFAYDKIFSRSVLLFAALGLIPLGAMAKLNAVDLGLRPVRWQPLLYAFPLGLAVLAPLILVFMVTDFRVVDDRVDYGSAEFLNFAAAALAGALLVGLFEETLFRGVMFSALRRSFRFVPAAATVSLVYGAVHFLEAEPLQGEPIRWYSGFLQLGSALEQLLQAGGHWDSFIALFLLGLLFCWIREYVNLWWCIGLHAAWVFGIRMFKEMTVRDVFSPYQHLVGTYDNFVGHLVSAWLLFLFVVLALYHEARAQRTPHQPGG